MTSRHDFSSGSLSCTSGIKPEGACCDSLLDRKSSKGSSSGMGGLDCNGQGHSQSREEGTGQYNFRTFSCGVNNGSGELNHTGEGLGG